MLPKNNNQTLKWFEIKWVWKKSLKYFSSFAAVKIGKNKSVHHHLLTNDGAHFFFANFQQKKKSTLLNLALMLFISKTFREVSLTTFNCRVGRGPKWLNNWTLQKDYVDAEKMKILMTEAKKHQALLPQNMLESLNNAVGSAY